MKGIDLGRFSIEPYGNDAFMLLCRFQDKTERIFQIGTRAECQEMMKIVQHDLGIN